MASIGGGARRKTRSSYAGTVTVSSAKKQKVAQEDTQAEVTLPRKTRRTSLRLFIPTDLVKQDLPYTFKSDVSPDLWQLSLEKNEEHAGKFMFYDAESKKILITHLPSFEHEKASRAMVRLMERTQQAYGVTDAQRMCPNGSFTTSIGQEADESFTPVQITQPGGAGPQVPLLADQHGSPYPTLVVEVRDYQSAPKLQQKIDKWLGRKTTTQLLLKLIIRCYDANQAGPMEWRMEATLYRAAAIRNNPPVVLQGPIEFGEVGFHRAALVNPCVGTGTHLLQLPVQDLYWGVPQGQIPAPLNAVGATWDLDLYELQQLILH